MSQAGKLAEGSPTIPGIETITGNSGGAVPGTGSPVNVNLLGGTGITVTGSPGTSTLTVALSGGGLAINSITPNSGTTPVVPDGTGLVAVQGTGSITTVGGLNSLTPQLTGLTQYNVLVGAGTATITKVAPSATSGVPLISQGAAADPAFGTAVVAGGGTGATTLTANSLLLGNGTSPVSALGAATNGQIPIGSTGGAPVLATISGGTGITIGNAAGSITINSTGGGLSWTDQTGAFTAAKNFGYFLSAAATPTMPAGGSAGDTIAFILETTSTVTITANTGETLRIGSSVSAASGTVASSTRGNAVTFVYRGPGNGWIASSVIGSWTVT